MMHHNESRWTSGYLRETRNQERIPRDVLFVIANYYDPEKKCFLIPDPETKLRSALRHLVSAYASLSESEHLRPYFYEDIVRLPIQFGQVRVTVDSGSLEITNNTISLAEIMSLVALHLLRYVAWIVDHNFGNFSTLLQWPNEYVTNFPMPLDASRRRPALECAKYKPYALEARTDANPFQMVWEQLENDPDQEFVTLEFSLAFQDSSSSV